MQTSIILYFKIKNTMEGGMKLKGRKGKRVLLVITFHWNSYDLIYQCSMNMKNVISIQSLIWEGKNFFWKKKKVKKEKNSDPNFLLLKTTRIRMDLCLIKRNKMLGFSFFSFRCWALVSTWNISFTLSRWKSYSLVYLQL